MVVRFVGVIRVPLCARVSRVCPVCVPAPRCLFTGTIKPQRAFAGLREGLQVTKRIGVELDAFSDGLKRQHKRQHPGCCPQRCETWHLNVIEASTIHSQWHIPG